MFSPFPSPLHLIHAHPPPHSLLSLSLALHLSLNRVPSGGVTLKRRCTYRPSVIYLSVNKRLSCSLSLDCFLSSSCDWCWCGAAAHASRPVATCKWGPLSSTSASTSGLSRPVLPRRLWRVVSWSGFLMDVVGGVESVMWEGCYPALTLAPTCEAIRAPCQVFIDAGARLLCTSDGVCVISYV